MLDATRLIQAVFGEPSEGMPFLAGPAFASTYPHAGDPAGAEYTYGRSSNPTWTAYETTLSKLEGGPCLVFGSGLAAVSAVLCSTLRPGDVVVMPSDSYFGAREFANGYLSAMGVEVRLVPTRDMSQGAFDGARLVVVESPSNPLLDVCDIAQVSRSAHDAGALVAVDNSTATVLGQQPLTLGADFSMGSDTKALSGHSDLLLGHVAVRDPAHLETLIEWRTHAGAIAGPMETWLAHRSLATLDVRLRRQCESALKIAEALSGHPSVLSCRYPGLSDDPAQAVAARQMAAYGPVLNFTLAGQSEAEDWLSQARLVLGATSFGGVHTTAERRARWGGDDIPAGFVRLSVGLEAAEDLVADILSALP